jgi:EAL domain-containing protein (putative c-di-GMP-specific phosphodiesterase class I)
VLDITAQSGPGNLLGNLLCAIANLLNSNGALSSIAQLLNQLLGALGCAHAQGYYFGRPVPPTELERSMRARRVA